MPTAAKTVGDYSSGRSSSTAAYSSCRPQARFPQAPLINGIDCTVTLPAGVTVKTDPATGETLPGVVVPVSLAATNSLVSAKYDKATGTVRIVLINVQPGFAVGEFAHLEFDGFPSAGPFRPEGEPDRRRQRHILRPLDRHPRQGQFRGALIRQG